MGANLNLGKLVEENNLYAELLNGKFGIELETVRHKRN